MESLTKVLSVTFQNLPELDKTPNYQEKIVLQPWSIYYIFDSNNQIIYVGQSSNFGDRLKKYEQSFLVKNKDNFLKPLVNAYHELEDKKTGGSDYIWFEIADCIYLPYNISLKELTKVQEELNIAETSLIQYLKSVGFKVMNVRSFKEKQEHKFQYFEKFNQDFSKLLPSIFSKKIQSFSTKIGESNPRISGRDSTSMFFKKLDFTHEWDFFKKQNIGVHKVFPNLLFQYSGVYRIHNSFHKKFYIGQSSELIKRFDNHNNGLLHDTFYKNKEFKSDVQLIKNNQQDPADSLTIEMLYCRFDMNNLSEHEKKIQDDELHKLEKHAIHIHRKLGLILYNDDYF